MKLSILRGAILGLMLGGGVEANAQVDAEAAEVDAQLISADNLEGLGALLVPHGWRVERGPEGDLLLFPPVPAGNADNGTTSDLPDQPGQGFEALRRQLESTGWGVERDAAGNLLLSPGGGAAPPQPEARVEPAPSASGFGRLRGQLEASGWLVERAPDGSVLLYPSQEQAAIASSGAEQPATTGFDRLRMLLEASGWRAEQSADGSLLLYPAPAEVVATPAPAQVPIATSSSCQGFSLSPAEQGRLALPVDSFNEAADIASRWLQTSAGEGLTLGRIRRILRIHLVSIVEDQPPFRLRNQLVIRNQDGCVVAVM